MLTGSSDNHQHDRDSSGRLNSMEEKEKLQLRITLVRTMIAVMLLFTLSNFIREYWDVMGLHHGFTYANAIQHVQNASSVDHHEVDFGVNTSTDKGSSRIEDTKASAQSPYTDGYVPLHQLVRVNETVECPHSLLLPIQSVHNPIADLGEGRKIPKIVHITGKSRCSTKKFVDATLLWTWPDHSFYFHDDQAVEKLLFERSWPEFPQLRNSWECLKNAGGAARADLWRYVAMWEYGGIYTDMDNLPGPLFNATTITPDTDAFFLQEQGGFLSQFFFAVAPKHPMMFLAVHDVMARTYHVAVHFAGVTFGSFVSYFPLVSLLSVTTTLRALHNEQQLTYPEMHSMDDTGQIYVPFATGPGTTKRSFIRFMGGTSKSPQEFLSKMGYPTAGTYVGKFGTNRSVTVVGSRSTGNNWVQRSVLGRDKALAWKLMNVSNYQEVTKEASGQTCLMKLHEWHAKQRQHFVEGELHRWRW